MTRVRMISSLKKRKLGGISFGAIHSAGSERTGVKESGKQKTRHPYSGGTVLVD